MPLNPMLGHGGTGFHGTGKDSAAVALKSLSTLRVSLVSGGEGGTVLPLAGIRQGDTILSALNNSSGTLTDITSGVSVASAKATGTVTVGTAAAGDSVSIAGLTYTLVAATAAVDPLDFAKVKVGADATATAANLRQAVEKRENTRTSLVSVTSVAGVVTVTAAADGTGGNALALAETGTTFTVSGGTLTGGTNTGGIIAGADTTQVIVYWMKTA